ncbi:MAG: hypothetical protein J0H08_04800 [Rhizobiales bacterium]|nr:hypothetical protein [Hyphomicrobiales bacterium]
MAQRDDVLVPAPAPEVETTLRMKLAAFVPLTIAMLGIAGVLLGGISARHDDTAALPAVDTISTGSIGAK